MVSNLVSGTLKLEDSYCHSTVTNLLEQKNNFMNSI